MKTTRLTLWNRQNENRVKIVEPAGFRDGHKHLSKLCPSPLDPKFQINKQQTPSPLETLALPISIAAFETSNRDVDAPPLLSSTTSSVAVPSHLPRCRPSFPRLRCLTAVRSLFIDLVHFTPSTLASTTSSVVSAPFPVILDDAVLPPLLDRRPLLGSNRKGTLLIFRALQVRNPIFSYLGTAEPEIRHPYNSHHYLGTAEPEIASKSLYIRASLSKLDTHHPLPS
ncbi:hypothetical protein PIB30_087143 [Stylosanthes scabra]|uniref:Uncharacterized protein n=1 Tax=Stylosanthes scabra TaxID=79078 RepID=A0ABU6US62_9FABA|nr:hypothetical protein [Stylosanthes scabra]